MVKDSVDKSIFKIDIGRAFRNLRVDSANALKFGTQWRQKSYVDGAVAFGWVHGSLAFQMVSDAIVHIMSTRGYKIFAYIDDFVAILPSDVATEAFQALYELICELGLPINPDKVIPPCKALTCLGIQINLKTRTLTIDPKKLRAIHDECNLTRHKKHLSRKAFQSLLGKLLYVHKCVRPARTFVNRMLSLFKSSYDHKRIKLTTEFYQDLNWFLQFLPQFNGTVILKKSHIDGDEVHIDASLTGLGGLGRIGSMPLRYTQFMGSKRVLFIGK